MGLPTREHTRALLHHPRNSPFVLCCASRLWATAQKITPRREPPVATSLCVLLQHPFLSFPTIELFDSGWRSRGGERNAQRAVSDALADCAVRQVISYAPKRSQSQWAFPPIATKVERVVTPDARSSARGGADPRALWRLAAVVLLRCCVLPLLSATLGVARAGGTDEHGRTARHSLCHLLMAGSRPCLTTSSTIVCARGRPRNLGIKHRIINSLQCHHIPDSA